ncbi:acetate/propionate family kinase [Roseateles amylovorans]|uniref:Acetate kinase n=1 Tax=Roseateles amylovorans TaxID=2978473 RepID=A0ABY6AZY8_9BURK|nr:acetate/propionate family kinase [Roseateles amylovorans]UXH78502.1 acetate/propionate family kinase [Roseateles amylovorans]
MKPGLEGDFIAVVNAGSSSIKLSMYSLHADNGSATGGPAGVDRKDASPLRLELQAQVEGLGTSPHFDARHADGSPAVTRDWPVSTLTHDRALDHLVEFVQHEFPKIELLGIGHRVVHGGAQLDRPVRVDDEVMAQLEALVPLAPLHQPHNLTPIRRAFEALPGLPQVACFDTAFHRTQSIESEIFALPYAMYQQGIRRYGFHGLSYEYIASRLPALSPSMADGRVVVLHLGNGASACALRHGHSLGSSMGFTALDGLPMGTRSGALDPGVLLYLMDRDGLDARALERLLYKESGLLGLSGVSSDMRALLTSEAPRARLAIEVFVHRISHEIGALAADLGGLDGLVFTAGIGEHAEPIRRKVLERCAWLGLAPDDSGDRPEHGERRISAPWSRCEAWVIPTDEALMVARHTYALLAGHG